MIILLFLILILYTLFALCTTYAFINAKYDWPIIEKIIVSIVSTPVYMICIPFIDGIQYGTYLYMVEKDLK